MKHGHCAKGDWSREYRSYRSMITRCTDSRSGSYGRYGGRGITIHQEWLNDFRVFLRDVGEAPSREHQLDRINPDGHYEPGNVRWATRTQNNRSRRNVKMVTVDGETLAMAEACERFGVPLKAAWARIKLGWPEEEAVRKPVDGMRLSRDPILRSMQVACRKMNVRWSVVRRRIQLGWTWDCAVGTPVIVRSVSKALAAVEACRNGVML